MEISFKYWHICVKEENHLMWWFINFKENRDAVLELSIVGNCSSRSEASVCGVKTVALIHVSQISFDKKVCGVKWLLFYNKIIRGHVALRKNRRAYRPVSDTSQTGP